MEYFTFLGFEGKTLPAVIWRPEGQVKAVLQITHGMTEHMGRYEGLAQDYTQLGVAVAGFDLRGHGKNPGDSQVASMGEGGWAASIEDMHLFFELLQRRFGGVPHYLLGFSLGSFLLREYLGKYPKDISGAVIMGTGHQPGWLLTIMRAITKTQINKAGFDGTTELIAQLSFGTYNQKFKPNRTSADWICADPEALDRYLADPLVRGSISAGLFWELLDSMKRTAKADSCRTWDRDTPILLLYGEHDPVGDAGKGVERVYRQMKQAGIRHLLYQMIPNARHDLLHEEANGAETVRHAIADWMIG